MGTGVSTSGQNSGSHSERSIRAKSPNQQVVRWIDETDDERLFLSVVTIGEIQRGIARSPQSNRKQALNKWLHTALLIRFQNRILPLTTAVMLTWGTLTAQGRMLPAVDSLIAALALYHDRYLVTHNVKDLEGTAVKLLNPWQT